MKYYLKKIIIICNRTIGFNFIKKYAFVEIIKICETYYMQNKISF